MMPFSICYSIEHFMMPCYSIEQFSDAYFTILVLFIMTISKNHSILVDMLMF